MTRPGEEREWFRVVSAGLEACAGRPTIQAHHAICDVVSCRHLPHIHLHPALSFVVPFESRSAIPQRVCVALS